jgi:hypothetical protein
MKLNITIEDLMELSEGQKRSLRSLWIPQKYDLATAFVCMNVETDEIDKIEFTVGNVLVYEINNGKRYEVRKYDKIYGNFNVTLRSLRLINEDLEEKDDEEEEEDEFSFEYISQEDYFNMEYCLPLLNIGQIIKMLEEFGYKSTGYNINFDPNKNMHSLTRPDSDILDGTFEAQELCDMLWIRLKSFLD